MQGDIDSRIYQSLLFILSASSILAMQVDIDSQIYQSLLFILSAMQGDIEHIDINLFVYKLNFSNARWHRWPYILKLTIYPISNARLHSQYYYISYKQHEIESVDIKLIIY